MKRYIQVLVAKLLHRIGLFKICNRLKNQYFSIIKNF